MKKVLIIILALLLVGGLGFMIADEPLPEGQAGPDAEALAEKMLAAIKVEAWEAIPVIGWSFRDAHHFVWDKKKHVAQVKWDDYEAVIDLNTVTGVVTKGGSLLEGADKEEAIQTAWAHFCNDSFWLNAPAKAFDPGTTRKIVTDDDGNNQLLVQYASGGVTPGDAYLWKLNEKYLPVSYKMWVSIIPIGGLEATWGDWKEFDGAMLATSHKLGPAEIPVGNIKTGKSVEEFGISIDLFHNF